MQRIVFLFAFIAALCSASTNAEPKATLSVKGERFVLTSPNGKQLTTKDLVGSTLDMADQNGTEYAVRIDAADPARERPTLDLLSLSVKDVHGNRVPFCDKDYYGRSAGFPVAGAFNRRGHFIPDGSRWFITCTSGSQGKCVLFGYDPWSKGPHGEDLAPYYEACQHMVRADYDGSGNPHTKNGTLINIYDDIGIEKVDPGGGDFEAGWKPSGAVCVAKTRWSDLLTLKQLQKMAPRLAGPCNEEIARKKGALIYNRSR
jgi:hypothetical protein